MTYILVGLLVVFLIYLFFETKKKAERVNRVVMEEKRSIAEDSGMTASLGVFTPDLQTTVIIGASETLGVFYYRMLKQARVSIRSRMNLANLSRAEFLVDGHAVQLAPESDLPTPTLCAADMADRTISQFSHDVIRQIQKAALKVVFYDETGQEKTLEITTLRSGDERHRFERVQLLKNTIWWAAFLQITSKMARRTRASLENGGEQPKESV